MPTAENGDSLRKKVEIENTLEQLRSLCPSNAADCSLPPHKIVTERVLGSLNGVYYRLVHKDTGNPIVLGIIGETRELARSNTLEAIQAGNADALAPAGEKTSTRKTDV